MWNISCSNSLDEYSTIPEIYNIPLLRNPTHELFHHILEIWWLTGKHYHNMVVSDNVDTPRAGQFFFMEGIGFTVHSAHTPMRANTCAHTWPGCCWCPRGTQGELETKPVFSAAPLRPSWLKSVTETVIVWFHLALQADTKPNQQMLELGIQTSQYWN